MVLDGAMTDTLDPAAETADLPIRRPSDNKYLAGNLAPVTEEITSFDLPTTGQIPVELEGAAGATDRTRRRSTTRRSTTWSSDGMVHGVRLRGGTAEWYRNRFVLDAAVRLPATNSGRTRTSEASPERRGPWSRAAIHRSSSTTS